MPTVSNLDLAAHWDLQYCDKDVEDLGWYEELPQPSLDLIRKYRRSGNDRIFLCGSGVSTLVDHLIEEGHEGLCAGDISEVALGMLKKRLGERSGQVKMVHVDLRSISAWKIIPETDIWHDRAVFHFFIAECDRQVYLANLNKTLRKGGYFVIGVFSSECTSGKCSGLPVRRYDLESLAEFLGKGFKLMESLRQVYTMPGGGDRDYLYAVFRKLN